MRIAYLYGGLLAASGLSNAASPKVGNGLDLTTLLQSDN